MDREYIVRALREHQAELKDAGVARLALFGSYARGTAVDGVSDVDLMAEFDSDRKYSLLDRVRLENRLTDILGCKVDLAPAVMLKDVVREHAGREAVVAF